MRHVMTVATMLYRKPDKKETISASEEQIIGNANHANVLVSSTLDGGTTPARAGREQGLKWVKQNELITDICMSQEIFPFLLKKHFLKFE